MGKYVGLDKIIEAVFESEVDLLPIEIQDNQKKTNYENSRVHLNKVFDVVGFNVSLLKGEGGFANKGIYQIPREDGSFIEWMIKNRNDKFFKALKAGSFEDCDQKAIMYIIEQLTSILIHMEVNDNIVELQKKLMEQKTQVYIRLPFQMMGERINRTAHAIYNLVSINNGFLSYEETCQYLDELEQGLDKYLNTMEGEYLERNHRCEKEMKKICPMLTNEEVEFSLRSHEIMDILSRNELYNELKAEYESLFLIDGKRTIGKREKNEKRKREVIKQMYEIFHSVTKELPVNVNEMTAIEKYMCLCGDEGFQLHYCKEEQCWLLHTSDHYFALDWIKAHTHPFNEE